MESVGFVRGHGPDLWKIEIQDGGEIEAKFDSPSGKCEFLDPWNSVALGLKEGIETSSSAEEPCLQELQISSNDHVVAILLLVGLKVLALRPTPEREVKRYRRA